MQRGVDSYSRRISASHYPAEYHDIQTAHHHHAASAIDAYVLNN